MRKNKLIKRTCRSCGLSEHTPEGVGTEVFDVNVQKQERLGHRLQRAGAEMSVTMGGHKKGGYAMQSQRGMKSKVTVICPRCGSKKIKAELIKVKVADAIKLLSGD